MKKEIIIRSILQPIWKAWYEYVSNKDGDGEIKFLNYGFHSPHDLTLLPEDEKERYPLQLYHHIISTIDVKDKHLLEVGCGRGGGASYIARYFKPRSMKAIDISYKAIEFCKSNHSAQNLEFSQGDALRLPFLENVFDSVINVESSHCYPNLAAFLSEVYKVLKPGGYFLYTDFRSQKNLVSVEENIKKSKFKVMAIHNITENVAQALKIDNDRRVQLIKRLVPRIIHKPVCAFAGTNGSVTYKSFESGWNTYYFYVLKKESTH
ncbi:MAG: class I SAM-dependent methyltransferase [Bacteroidales bacterium]|jgi:SAM-dependent methyltransferase|nr:class I SAM-dependent methyltransferase [Bacteroidales bacterium]MDD3330456.1 class I SAM-dependent methyltransferase [Bacteroidales bacterium]MDD3690679.1 class I SAM-dependent methyltransferase [Bacteroidales bacterium]MDD4043821.1 class I SAM-dependent methyltransferase [Bacteroidales bacterium]MDD4580783.1 class I SAM-dependent methyltransferase [Bacteroidales bacterium]